MAQTRNWKDGDEGDLLLGFKDNLPVLKTMPKVIEIKGRLPIKLDPKTGEQYLTFKGKRLKIVKEVPPFKYHSIKNAPDKDDKEIKCVKKINNSSPVFEPKSGKDMVNVSVQTCREYEDKSCQTKEVLILDCSSFEEIGPFNDSINGPNVNIGCGPKMSQVQIVSREEELKYSFFKDFREALDFDSNGNLPIHRAVLSGDLDRVRKCCVALKGRQLTIDLPNQSEQTPLQLAILEGANILIVTVLLQYNADLSLTDHAGNSPLHLAVQENRMDILEAFCKRLKELNSDLDYFNYEGYTPLILSVLLNRFECAQVLLYHDVDPNIQDRKSGRTALFHAAETHNFNLVKLLLSCNADPKVRNFFGSSTKEAMHELDDIPYDIKSLILSREAVKRKSDDLECNNKKILKTVPRLEYIGEAKRPQKK